MSIKFCNGALGYSSVPFLIFFFLYLFGQRGKELDAMFFAANMLMIGLEMFSMTQ